MMVLRVVLFAGLARLLQPQDFGLFAACTSVLGILEVMTLLGVSPALVQRKDLSQRHISTACVLAAILGGLAAGGIWISAGWIAAMMKIAPLREVLRTVAPIFFIRGCSMVGYGLAVRAMRFSLTTFAEIVAFFAYGTTAVILALCGFGAWSLILAYVVQQGLLSLLVILPFSAQLSWRCYRKELGELLGFCSGMSVANIASYVASYGDNYVVGRVLGVESLGFYSRAYNLMQTFATSVTNTLDQVFFPSLARVQNETASLARALRLSTALVWLGYLPLTVILVLCAPAVVGLLLGAKWLPMVPAFRILVYGLVFRSGYKMAVTILKVQGKTARLAVTQIVYAAMVVLGATVGSRWGIEGAAGGVFVALGANYILVNFLGFRSIQQPFAVLWRDLAAALVLTVAVLGGSVAVGLLATRFGLNPVVRLTGTILAAGGICTLFVSVFAPVLVSLEVREFLGTLWRGMGKRWSKIGRRLSVLRPIKPYWAKA